MSANNLSSDLKSSQVKKFSVYGIIQNWLNPRRNWGEKNVVSKLKEYVMYYTNTASTEVD